MIKTSLIPEGLEIDLYINIPSKYMSKQLEVVLYEKGEDLYVVSKAKTMADFRGIITKDEANE